MFNKSKAYIEQATADAIESARFNGSASLPDNLADYDQIWAAGMYIHTEYDPDGMHEYDVTYIATQSFVENYERSGGIWTYN